MRFWMKTAVLVIGIFVLSGCERSNDEAHEHAHDDEEPHEY